MIPCAFRPLEAKHCPRVAELEQCINPSPWSETLLVQELDNPRARFFVGERLGVILCYGGYWNLAGSAHISNIAVRSRFRKRGLGGMLLQFLLAEMRQEQEQPVQEALLEVRAANLPAIRLYEGAGFQHQGRRPGYYQNGEDALLYVLPVQPRAKPGSGNEILD